jgi:nicotinamidase/pyrazinamidase
MCYVLRTSSDIGERGSCALVIRSEIVLWAVDTQVDFMLPGGKLYVPGAEKLIPNIKRLVDTSRDGRTLLIASGCQHEEDDPEFAIFPPHCVRGTPGAEFIPEVLTDCVTRVPNDPDFTPPAEFLSRKQILIEKQTIDVFESHHTPHIVRGLPPKAEIFLFGVVTEHCVRSAAKGLLDHGRRVSVIHDAIETLDPVAGHEALSELSSGGACFLSTGQALSRLLSLHVIL